MTTKAKTYKEKLVQRLKNEKENNGVAQLSDEQIDRRVKKEEYNSFKVIINKKIDLLAKQDELEDAENASSLNHMSILEITKEITSLESDIKNLETIHKGHFPTPEDSDLPF